MNENGNGPESVAGSSEAPKRSVLAELMSSRLIRERFTNVIFSDSHGACDRYLGAGYLYYAFAATLRSQVSVCIGSGGGFVPDLLAQAQRDLCLDPAATYLIDANLPDLGFGSPIQAGGWLRPESDFSRRASDIVFLKMLSADAARLFASERIRIDYLHIDGDHSRRGVVADFEDFAPLLSSDAVVSFHDAALASVQTALEQIRRDHLGWECLSLPEIGNGSAFMRQTRKDGLAARPGASEQMADRQRRTRLGPSAIAAGAAESANRARYERWHYLATPAYRTRYEVIAPEVDRDGGTVIEIGGFPNSVVDVLARSARVMALEPYAPDNYVARVRAAARSKGIDYELRFGSVAAADFLIENITDYALVCLGLDISSACDTIADFEASLFALLRLVRGANIVAAEFPQYPPSIAVWSFLEACLKLNVVRDLKLDLSADPVADEYCVKDNRARRRVIVFHSSKDDNAPGAEIIRDYAARLYSLKEELPPVFLPGEDEMFHIRPVDLPSPLVRHEAGVHGERTFSPGVDEPGNVTYGPYVRLRPGKYRAIVRYDSPAGADSKIGHWDVCVGLKILLDVPMIGTNGVERADQAEFVISNESSRHLVEVRVFYSGTAIMCFKELIIEPIA